LTGTGPLTGSLGEIVRYAQNKEVVARQIEGETIIVPIRRGVGDMNSVYTLNPVGTVLWHFMAMSHSVPEMAERICNEFEVTPGQALGDVEGFVSALLEEKLIQEGAESGLAEGSGAGKREDAIVTSSHIR
jgi:hypothetical protein